MALCQLSHLVVNDAQFGTNWYPIGPQSYPNRSTIVTQLVYDLVVTMGKMAFSIVHNSSTRHSFQSNPIQNLFLYMYDTHL